MRPIRAIAILLFLPVLGCGDPVAEPRVVPDDPVPDDDTALDDAVVALPTLPDVVIDDLVNGFSTPILVQLGPDPVPEHPLTDPRRLQKFAERWPEVVADFEMEMPLQAWIARSYRHLPILAIEVGDLASAYALLDHPDVVSIEAAQYFEKSDAEALVLINQPEAAALGYTGSGASVAIFDTGVDYRHADFGHCTGVGTPASCKVTVMEEFARSDNRLDADGHGTNVAAIALSVAPEAEILGMDVFDGEYAYSPDILDAIDWTIEHQATYNIASINMSLGGGGYNSPCTHSVFETGIAAAKAAGISVVVASGNDGFTNSISSPACSPSAFSVGAVHDAAPLYGDCRGVPYGADVLACFSNSSSFLDILAPGVQVTAGGYTMSGTSMAAPHVAGAVAVLRAADPNATVQELQQRLTSTGASVTDHRNGLAFPRVDLEAAVDGIGCSLGVDPRSLALDALGESGSISVQTPDGCTFAVTSSAPWLSATPTSGDGDTTLTFTALPNAGWERSATLEVGSAVITAVQAAATTPSGSIAIEGGAELTNSSAVTLTLSAEGADQMCISDSESSCRRWEEYETEKRWRLRGRGSGERTVYAWFSSDGVVGEMVSDSIDYDRGLPRYGDLEVTGSDEGLTLTWGGFIDDYSGVVSYLVEQTEGSRAPLSRCRDDSPIYTGDATSLLLTGLEGTYSWRVCPVDAAGNIGTGAVASYTTRPEYDPPTGSIVLADGRDWTNETRVMATLSASDASGVESMCLSMRADRCRRFVRYATSARLVVRGDGEHTAYVWYRDVHGNTSGPFSDSIRYEREQPEDGTVSAEASDATITLTLAGFSDADSGIAGYRVMGSTTSARPGRRCRSGDVLYEGPGDIIVLSGLPNGETHQLHLCAVDAAGNVSNGVSGVATPVPERDAPVGSIDLGGRYTSSPWIEASVSASDPSGVTEMCVTTRLPCRRFSPFEETVRLSVGYGDTTVYAQFRDRWGNESDFVSAVIGLDRRAPDDGTVTILPGDGEITLAFADFVDEASGVASYSVFVEEGIRPPRSCRGTPDWTGSAPTATFGGLTNGQAYSFLVCATDAVGNTSRGERAGPASPAPELVPPVGTVEIEGGAEWTTSRRVELTLSATDDSGVARMCIDTRGYRCTRWVDYEESYRASISGHGEVEVRVWFEDVWGNQSEVAVDTIGLDYDRPVDGALHARASGTTVDLHWSGFGDDGSGVVGYKLMRRAGRAPSNCRIGDLVYEGAELEVPDVGLEAGVTYGYRICAVDAAGNESRGASATVTTGH